MVEFSINSSVNATTGYTPLELNYGYMLWSGQHILTDTTFKGIKQFAQQAVWNLLDVHDAILEHRIEKMHYSNKHCKPGIEFQINHLVYLTTINLALPTHWAWKCSNYRVEIGTVGIKNLEDLANRNSSVTVRTLIYW